MQDEIDLRPYVSLLFSHWAWILVPALIVALAAYLVSLAMPAVYEATALIVVSQPRYVLRFDPRLQTVEERQPPYRAYPTLATSNDVLLSLLDALDSLPSGIGTVDDLRDTITADSGADPSLLLLRVRTEDATEAARIANVWAQLAVDHGNAIYGRDEAVVAFFEAQLASAEIELQDAEATLIAFQGGNQKDILTNRLSSLHQVHSESLARRSEMLGLIHDIQGLKAQLALQSVDGAVSLTDQLSALLLQIKALNVQTEMPIQLQIADPQALSDQRVAELIASLDSLLRVLEQRIVELDSHLMEIEPQILRLQQDLEQIRVEEATLIRAKTIAEETVITLARKVEETRIAAQDGGGEMVIASRALPPSRPVAPRRMMNAAIAGTLAGILAVFVVFGLAWWRQEQ